MSSSIFMIVGPKGPMYEAAPENVANVDGPNSYQFVMHASLDLVNEVEWSTPALFLKTVDRFNDRPISAYVTPGRAIFLLLHDNKSDDNVSHFFKEVHQLYIKEIMNPFQKRGDPIESQEFDDRVRKTMKNFV
jgi:trafficking protein particle complex subunit 2